MCIFCQIANKEIPTSFVYEDAKLMAFNDLHPLAPVHILIVPKKHIATINDLQAKDKELMGEMIWLAKNLAAEKGVASTGYKLIFNCGENGGQIIQHVHLHLLGGKKIDCLV